MKLRVLLTRDEGDNARWAEGLRSAGHEALELACIRCEVIGEAAVELSRELPGCSWLAFSSRRAVEAFVELRGPKLNVTKHIACVGQATARRALLSLGRVDLVASAASGRSLGRELGRAIGQRGARVLYPAALETRAETLLELRAAGVEPVHVPVYRTVPAAPLEPRLALELDAIFLASPSAVRGMSNQLIVPPRARIVCIGPASRAAAEAVGLRVDAEARTRDLAGMLAALAELEGRRRSEGDSAAEADPSPTSQRDPEGLRDPEGRREP